MELYDEALMYYHLSLDSDPGSKAARANRDLALSGKSVRDLPPPPDRDLQVKKPLGGRGGAILKMIGAGLLFMLLLRLLPYLGS
ncbi:MAG: hypothetical protein MPL62_04765 [Alphaproteobacteria bacterium]|nr:hypothetical protein [Alphaproteobacteria bacterium]